MAWPAGLLRGMACFQHGECIWRGGMSVFNADLEQAADLSKDLAGEIATSATHVGPSFDEAKRAMLVQNAVATASLHQDALLEGEAELSESQCACQSRDYTAPVRCLKC
eukprot:6474737-Amphidinium_carterae.3